METHPIDLSLWKTAPLRAFISYICSPEYKKTALKERRKYTLSEESVNVYKAMFSRFLKFLETRQSNLFSVTPDDIYAFLTTTQSIDGKLVPVLESEIQYRYLRLLERIFTHLCLESRPTDNLLFGPLKEHYKLRGKNNGTVALTDAEVAVFMSSLPESSAERRPSRSHAGWKKRRDRALQCTVLGAGLTVSEIVSLKVSDIESSQQTDGTIKITIQDYYEVDGMQFQSAHSTYMNVQFVEELIQWLNERRQIFAAENNSYVFPGTNGKMLNKATVYRQIRKTFDAAGIDLPRRGGRTLRNTFAVSEIKNGTDAGVLLEKMGLFEQRSLEIYTSVASMRNI